MPILKRSKTETAISLRLVCLGSGETALVSRPHDGVQQRTQFLVGGRTGLGEGGRAVRVAAVHAVQHRAVQGAVDGFPGG